MKKTIFLVFFVAFSKYSFGQLNNIQEIFNSKNGKSLFIIFDTTKYHSNDSESISLIAEYFKLSKNDNLVFKSMNIETDGLKHTRYEQFHSGVKELIYTKFGNPKSS